MGLLSRKDIIDAQDLAHEDVEVPEWGGTVRIQAMTGAQRDKIEGSVTDAKGTERFENFRAKVLACSIVDENGKPLFRWDDAALLGKKNSAVVGRLFEIAQRLSNFGLDGVDEMEKNSVAVQNGASGSS